MKRMRTIVLVLVMCCSTAKATDIPEIVLQYADAYAKAHPGRKTSSDENVSEEYARWFFLGMTGPFNWTKRPSPLAEDAYTHGEAFLREHPAERDNIFAGFGYLPIEKTGRWWYGFETSAFKPDRSNGHPWWIRTVGDTEWWDLGLEPPDAEKGTRSVRISISGYVSPEGHYGHLGVYPREVWVVSGRPVAVE